MNERVLVCPFSGVSLEKYVIILCVTGDFSLFFLIIANWNVKTNMDLVTCLKRVFEGCGRVTGVGNCLIGACVMVAFS